MGGSKETFFGSDRFELMASVIGELYSWNNGQGVTECFVPFLPQGKNGKDPSRMSKHNFKILFTFWSEFFKKCIKITHRDQARVFLIFLRFSKNFSPRSSEGISE